MNVTSSFPEALVLLAHGSRDTRWREPFETLCQRAQAALTAPTVALAYMEMCEPSFETVARGLYEAGTRTIALLPLFMSAGGHVRHDIPSLAAQAEACLPGLAVRILPPVGEHPKVQAAFLEVFQEVLAADAPPGSASDPMNACK